MRDFVDDSSLSLSEAALRNPAFASQLWSFIASEMFKCSTRDAVQILENILSRRFSNILEALDNAKTLQKNLKSEQQAFSLLIHLIEKPNADTVLKIHALVLFVLCIDANLVNWKSSAKARGLFSTARLYIKELTVKYIKELDDLSVFEKWILNAVQSVSPVKFELLMAMPLMLYVLLRLYSGPSIIGSVVLMIIVNRLIHEKLTPQAIADMKRKQETFKMAEELMILSDTYGTPPETHQKSFVDTQETIAEEKSLRNRHTASKNDSKESTEKKSQEDSPKKEKTKPEIPIPHRALLKRKKELQKPKSWSVYSVFAKVASPLNGIVTLLKAIPSIPRYILDRCLKSRKKEDRSLFTIEGKNKKSKKQKKGLSTNPNMGETSPRSLSDQEGTMQKSSPSSLTSSAEKKKNGLPAAHPPPSAFDSSQSGGGQSLATGSHPKDTSLSLNEGGKSVQQFIPPFPPSSPEKEKLVHPATNPPSLAVVSLSSQSAGGVGQTKRPGADDTIPLRKDSQKSKILQRDDSTAPIPSPEVQNSVPNASRLQSDAGSVTHFVSQQPPDSSSTEKRKVKSLLFFEQHLHAPVFIPSENSATQLDKGEQKEKEIIYVDRVVERERVVVERVYVPVPVPPVMRHPLPIGFGPPSAFSPQAPGYYPFWEYPHSPSMPLSHSPGHVLPTRAVNRSMNPDGLTFR